MANKIPKSSGGSAATGEDADYSDLLADDGGVEEVLAPAVDAGGGADMAEAQDALVQDDDATGWLSPNKVVQTAQAASSMTDAVDPGIEVYRQQFRDAPKIDDDYLKTIHGRQQRANKAWAAQSSGVDPAQLDTPDDVLAQTLGFDDAEQKRQWEDVKWFYSSLWEKEKAVAAAIGKDLKGVVTDARQWAIGGPLRAVASFLDVADQAYKGAAAGLADPGKTAQMREMYGDEVVDLALSAMANADTQSLVPDPYGARTQEPETFTGKILQTLTQFMTGYGAAGKLTGIGNSLAGATAKGALTDFLAFKGEDGNATDIAKIWPEIQNPVFEFLQTSEDRPDLENRLKNSLVGAGVGAAVVAPVMAGFRGIRKLRREMELNGGTHEEAAERLAKGGVETGEGFAPEDVGGRLRAILGDPGPEAPLVTRRPVAFPDESVDFGVPDHVAARSLAEVEGSAKAPDIEPGMKRVYVLDPKAEPPSGVVIAVDDLGHMQKALRGSGGVKGDWAIYFYDIPADVKPGRVSDVTGNHYRLQIGTNGFGGNGGPNLYSREFDFNWAKVNSPEDLKMLQGQLLDSYAPEIEKARRGHRSFASIVKDASDEDAWRLMMGERKGNILDASETLALRTLWESAKVKVAEVAKVAVGGDVESMIAFRKMIEVYRLIQMQVMGVRAEQGRALSQWNIPVGAGSREQMQAFDRMLQESGGEKVTRQLAKDIADLSGKPEFATALNKRIKTSVWAKTMASVKEGWINSILSGPKTHMVNMTSNKAVAYLAMLERGIAARISSVLSPVEGVQIGEAMAMLHGENQAIKDMFVYVARNAKARATGGEVGMESPFFQKTTGQLDTPRTRAISAEGWDVSPDTMMGKGIDMVGSVLNLPGTMLEGADTLFKTTARQAQLHALAVRQAGEEIERGLLQAGKGKERIAELMADPTEAMRMKASEFAHENTFTTAVGPIADKFIKTRDLLDRAALGIPIGTMTMPFIRTPANIMKYGFERSPLAPLMGKVRADYAAGGARRDLALARMGLGSLVMSVGLDLALDGHITGSGPSGDKQSGKRQAQVRSGWQPFSIRTATGESHPDGSPIYRYYAYNRLDPMGMQLGLAAELAQVLNNTHGRVDEQFGEVAVGAVLGAANVMMNKTYLSQFANLVDAMHSPERYGENYFLRLGSGFVPTAVKEVSQYMDPVSRHVWDMTSALKARTPGLSDTLPARLDFWGREIEFSSGLGATYDAVSPIYSKSTEKAVVPIEREFFRLNYFPTHQGVLNVEGADGKNKPIPLRNMPDVRNRFITLSAATKASDLLAGNEEGMVTKRGSPSSLVRNLQEYGDRTLQQAMADVIAGKIDTSGQRRGGVPYAEANADEQAKMLGDVLRHYHQAAKIQVLREFPRLRELRDTIPSREELGVEAPF